MTIRGVSPENMHEEWARHEAETEYFEGSPQKRNEERKRVGQLYIDFIDNALEVYGAAGMKSEHKEGSPANIGQENDHWIGQSYEDFATHVINHHIFRRKHALERVEKVTELRNTIRQDTSSYLLALADRLLPNEDDPDTEDFEFNFISEAADYGKSYDEILDGVLSFTSDIEKFLEEETAAQERDEEEEQVDERFDTIMELLETSVPNGDFHILTKSSWWLEKHNIDEDRVAQVTKSLIEFITKIVDSPPPKIEDYMYDNNPIEADRVHYFVENIGLKDDSSNTYTVGKQYQIKETDLIKLPITDISSVVPQVTYFIFHYLKPDSSTASGESYIDEGEVPVWEVGKKGVVLRYEGTPSYYPMYTAAYSDLKGMTSEQTKPLKREEHYHLAEWFLERLIV